MLLLFILSDLRAISGNTSHIKIFLSLCIQLVLCMDCYLWNKKDMSPCLIFSIFSSETTRPIELKFHMETPKDGGTKVCSNVPGHVTKMAAMPIYGRNP